MKTIDYGDRGPAVEDVQNRLEQLGYDLGAESGSGVYGETTLIAVRAFRRDHQLVDASSIDAIAWSALVDATFTLGDRMLYLRLPYLHGNDVRMLQTALNVLGFFYHDVDGIFGGETETAVREFQLNIGLPADGIAGNTTFLAIERLGHVWKGKTVSSYEEEQTGFARVVAVLESTPLCVYGTNELSRQVALRIGNLATATTSSSKIESAETLSREPSTDMGLVQIAEWADEVASGTPQVLYTEDPAFMNQVVTVVQKAREGDGHFAVVLPEHIPLDAAADDVTGHSIEQHMAVRILDALCIAYI